MVRFHLKSEILLFCLAIATLIAIPAKSLLVVTQELELVSSKNRFTNDSQQGGASHGHYTNTRKTGWNCLLIESAYQYPYCGHQFFLKDSFRRGVNLSKFDSLTVNLKYLGAAATVRVYLRNFNAAYSSVKDQESTKYNIVEFEKELLDAPFEIDLKRFKVADWWLSQRNIPFKLSKPDLSNITVFEVQTGSDAPLGKHYFEQLDIVATKQLISNEDFYLGLVIFWVTTILAYLGHRLSRQNIEISRQRDLARRLRKKNASLDRLTEELVEKTKTDNLTQLLNREGANLAISEALSAFYSSRTRFSFVIFDIDHFKKINDEHGHDVGDQILIEFSQLIADNIRVDDKLARWGGEEFLILSNRTELKTAAIMAKKLRATVEAHTFSSGLKITASFGVASIELGLNSDELFKCADTALYKAKQEGRNRVNIYSHW